MYEFWKIAVGVAGLGAVVSFVVWSVYKQWLKLPIFQTVTKKQQFLLFRLLIIFTFLFGLAGLGTYAYLKYLKRVEPNSRASKSLVVLVDSFSRRHVLEQLEKELQHIGGVAIDREPIRSDWLHEADVIAAKAPSTVVAHFHALRGIDARNHFESEEDLLIGLSRIRAHTPEAWFVIYSSGFILSDDTINMRQIRDAAGRITNRDPTQRTHMDMVVARIKTASWREQPSDQERQALFSIVKDLSK